MSEVIHLAALVDSCGARAPQSASAIRTDVVNILFTTIDETFVAVRVAAALGDVMAAPLTLIHFRTVQYPLSLDAPAGVSPVETAAFVDRLRSQGIDMRVRVYLCRDADRALPLALRPHSLIVIGGRRRSWWPTPAERLQRRLERAGHFVVFVDSSEHEESFDA
jgi:hypothetical protein